MRRGVVWVLAAVARHAAEHLVLDPLDRLVEDSPQVAQRVLADRLGVPGDRAQVAAELPGELLEIAIGIRVGPAVMPGRARPATLARPAGPLAPLPAAPVSATTVAPSALPPARDVLAVVWDVFRVVRNVLAVVWDVLPVVWDVLPPAGDLLAVMRDVLP